MYITYMDRILEKTRFLNFKYEFKKSNDIFKCLKLVVMTHKNAPKLCVFQNNIIYSSKL